MGKICSRICIYQTPVHPHVFTTHRRQSPTDLFTALEELKRQSPILSSSRLSVGCWINC
ncbi:hypothetical protein MtrunA17_Chr7g0263961 [Medicago truncatula]|uniref:Uncharacterized protein n=1 Tax=Medicago truncatula TaxID=3880 RepID=A0A396HB30_MEDTR|nr:hypothetical protein MtrunA17_Chr7g0263961 [Medicago truncatula]